VASDEGREKRGERGSSVPEGSLAVGSGFSSWKGRGGKKSGSIFSPAGGHVASGGGSSKSVHEA